VVVVELDDLTHGVAQGSQSGVHPRLEQLFDAEYAGWPRGDLVYERLRHSGTQVQRLTKATGARSSE
jgi:hypothetical protein